ncbi:MFS transporter [Amycolatopsis acidiphila]|uniref:MFS transporter n=1 Tax=Amycolatopsis acidiphila TaxID=715473 RepID=A0A558A066_9PSEU|nr:MFS transporter [Amycolatopsis acidiphila]TVT17663.1 MFS transporter [Amycolatopsis acidiphila]UIJ63747.1 MFS transporter [Amycolatopsis acidiphila]
MKVAVAAAGISSFALLYAPQPVLPQLAAQYHLDPGAASLAISVATGALAIAVLPIAALSEIVGRRPVILTSVIAAAVLGLLLPLAPSYGVLLVLRALQGAAIAGFPGVAAAYLVEKLGKTGVAAAVGAMIAGNSVGGMLGRLSAGFSAEALGYHGALIVVAGVGTLFTVLTVLTLPRSRRAAREPKPAIREQLRGVLVGVGAALGKPVLLAQYVVGLLAMGSFVAMYNAAGFRLTGAPLDLSPAIASLVFLAYAMGSVSSATVGKLVGRFGRLRTAVCALLVTVLGILLTLPDSLVLVVLGFLVLTGGFFAAHAVANSWTAAEAPEGARGQASGTYTLTYYLGSSVGGTVGSIVYAHAGWGWLVAATSCWLLIAVVAVTFTARRGSTPFRTVPAAG